MRFLKKKDIVKSIQALNSYYVKENKELRQDVLELTNQVKDLSQSLLEVTQRYRTLESKFEELNNTVIDLDESFNSFDLDEFCTRDDVRNMIDDALPSDLDDAVYAYSQYDFDDFATSEDISRLCTRINELQDMNKGNVLYEANPDAFKVFLHNISEYISKQTQD